MIQLYTHFDELSSSFASNICSFYCTLHIDEMFIFFLCLSAMKTDFAN